MDYEDSVLQYNEHNIKKYKSNANRAKTLLIESNQRNKERILSAISEQEKIVDQEIERFIMNTSLLLDKLRSAEVEIKRSVDNVLKRVRQTKEDLIERSIENVMKQSLKKFEDESIKQTKEFEETLSVTLKSQRKIAKNRRKQFEDNLTKLQRREKKMIENAIESIEISIEQAGCEVSITERLVNTVESIAVSKCKNVLSEVLSSSMEMRRVLDTLSMKSVIPQRSKDELEKIVDNTLKILRIGDTTSGKPLYLDLGSYNSDSD